VRAGNQLARWPGVVVLGLDAIDQIFLHPAYPLCSLGIIAMDIVALYGLCASRSRANLDAALPASACDRKRSIRGLCGRDHSGLGMAGSAPCP
jgi:hypothetical protein